MSQEKREAVPAGKPEEESVFCRTRQLIGPEGLERLGRARVAVFGIGGVGGYAAEALMRSGVGTFLLVDPDRVSVSNCNRQIIATLDTVGRPKVEVMRQRILSVNPQAKVETRQEFFSQDNAHTYPLEEYDYLVDAIDSVSSKLLLAQLAAEKGLRLISCMGTGNKLDPSRLEIADISETSVCPLARVMRRELGKRGIRHLRVVYSKEPPARALSPESRVPASIAFVPSAAGLLMASQVVRELREGD